MPHGQNETLSMKYGFVSKSLKYINCSSKCMSTEIVTVIEWSLAQSQVEHEVEKILVAKTNVEKDKFKTLL